MQDVHDRAGGATGKMDTLAKRLSTLESRATGLEEIGNRIETLRGGVRKVEETAKQLLATDGELQKHRHEVQQLLAQATQNVALLDAMKKEQRTLDKFWKRLRVTQVEVEDSASKTTSLKARVAELKHQVDKTGAAFREVKRDDAAITAQEKRLAELVDELGRVQLRQRDVTAQIQLSED